MVSQASFFVTKALIFAIFCIVKANVILIIVGNPSGTAATIKAIQTTNAVFIGPIESRKGTTPDVSISIPPITILTVINTNNKAAIILDIFAIVPPKLPSLICNGVSSSSI